MSEQEVIPQRKREVIAQKRLLLVSVAVLPRPRVALGPCVASGSWSADTRRLAPQGGHEKYALVSALGDAGGPAPACQRLPAPLHKRSNPLGGAAFSRHLAFEQLARSKGRSRRAARRLPAPAASSPAPDASIPSEMPRQPQPRSPAARHLTPWPSPANIKRTRHGQPLTRHSR